MIAPQVEKTQVLVEPDVRRKLAFLSEHLREALSGQAFQVPEAPGRDVQIVSIRDLPPKKGLSSVEGQARLLHDLASIELQAMELALRTLIEFPEAHPEFRRQLAEVCAEEGYHLGLCLDAMEGLGMPWGSFPTHLGLWQATSKEDSLLDRLVIVHRYLEGSGLDASDTLLRRLNGVRAEAAAKAVTVIRRDEIGHVQFGSEWYRQFVREAGSDPDQDFTDRLTRMFHRIPRRLEPICHETRRLAGFSDREIAVLENVRERWLQACAPGGGPERIHKRYAVPSRSAVSQTSTCSDESVSG